MYFSTLYTTQGPVPQNLLKEETSLIEGLRIADSVVAFRALSASKPKPHKPLTKP